MMSEVKCDVMCGIGRLQCLAHGDTELPKHSFFVVFSLCKAIRQARKKEGSSRKIVGVPMASTSLNTVGPVLIRTETIRG